eukprot:scaffold227952_cov70-Cyclotella_meneghiniana.AAC.2
MTRVDQKLWDKKIHHSSSSLRPSGSSKEAGRQQQGRQLVASNVSSISAAASMNRTVSLFAAPSQRGRTGWEYA